MAGSKSQKISKDVFDEVKIKFNKEETEKIMGRTRIIFDFAPDAIYLLDEQGNVLDGNKAAEKLFNLKIDEIIGKNILTLNILPDDQKDKAIKEIQKIIQNKNETTLEYTINKKDSSAIYTFLACSVTNFTILGFASS